MNKSKLLSLSLLVGLFIVSSVDLMAMKRKMYKKKQGISKTDQEIIDTLRHVRRSFRAGRGRSSQHARRQNIQYIRRLTGSLGKSNRARDLRDLREIIKLSIDYDNGRCNGSFLDLMGSWLPRTVRKNIRAAMEKTIRAIRKHYGYRENNPFMRDYKGWYGRK